MKGLDGVWELVSAENTLAAARRSFNRMVQSYNSIIQQVPTVLFARTFSFAPHEFFNLGEEREQIEQTPQVKLLTLGGRCTVSHATSFGLASAPRPNIPACKTVPSGAHTSPMAHAEFTTIVPPDLVLFSPP